MSGRTICVVVGLAALVAAGCSPSMYTQQADRDVYHIVADKNAEALGRAPEFSIKPRSDLDEVLGDAHERNVAPEVETTRDVKPVDTMLVPTGVPGVSSTPGAVIPSEQSKSRNLAGAVTSAADTQRDPSTSLGVTAQEPRPAPPSAEPPKPASPAPLIVPPPQLAPRAAGRPLVLPEIGGPAASWPTPEEIMSSLMPPVERVFSFRPAPVVAGTPQVATSPVPEPGPGAIRLTVADALRVAVRANRDYQSQKETVYLTALALTFQQYLFRPHPTTTGTINFESNAQAGPRQKQWNATSDIGVSQQLMTGALVTADLGLTALHFLNPGIGDAVDSTLGFTLNQPLWRRSSPQIVQENLIQADRNTLYQVRTFARYEQTFAVSVASQYLLILQQRDAVLNQWRSYLSLRDGRERAEWLAKAERLPQFQVDQARQNELSAYNNWVVARESYVNALDAFKIVLGLPVMAEIVLDPNELRRLDAEGLAQHTLPPDEARAQALIRRLDFLNAIGGVEDAERKILVAEDSLNGDVELVGSVAYASVDRSPQSARLVLKRGNYSVGLAINLPIDRLTERNALRSSQISRDQAARSASLLRDQVLLSVNVALRQLEQSRESYEIQQRSMALAERRVESTQLLLQAGRATQRDVLDAESSLLDARNALTSALVAHAIAGLAFQRDVGTLVVDGEGQIHGWNLTDGRR